MICLRIELLVAAPFWQHLPIMRAAFSLVSFASLPLLELDRAILGLHRKKHETRVTVTVQTSR